MHHHGDSSEGTLQTLRVAYVTDKISQAGMIKSPHPHVMLLELVAAEDDQLLRMVVAEHRLHKLFPERSGAARDQHNLFRPIHPWALLGFAGYCDTPANVEK